jgi:hypothetical protein
MERTAVGFQSIRDAEVRAGTGKDWAEWCAVIEAAQLRNSISVITEHLCTTYNIDLLWAQIIAVYYKWHV